MTHLSIHNFPFIRLIRRNRTPCQFSTYALNAVDGLYNRRVFEGDEKGNFNPNGTLTRGEFTAILYRLAVSVGAV